MFTLRRSFRFADTILSVKSESPVSIIQDAVQCHPELPDGMRVDFCALDTVTLDCKAGERIEIALEIIPADTAEWEVWEDTGEFLDAVSFYSTSGDEASTGLRDPEWMEWQYPLRCLRAPTDKLLRGATYEATASAKLWIQSAVAWTTNPSPQEEDSPNYAVDKALPSKGGH